MSVYAPVSWIAESLSCKSRDSLSPLLQINFLSGPVDPGTSCRSNAIMINLKYLSFIDGAKSMLFLSVKMMVFKLLGLPDFNCELFMFNIVDTKEHKYYKVNLTECQGYIANLLGFN